MAQHGLESGLKTAGVQGAREALEALVDQEDPEGKIIFVILHVQIYYMMLDYCIRV